MRQHDLHYFFARLIKFFIRNFLLFFLRLFKMTNIFKIIEGHKFRKFPCFFSCEDRQGR